MKKVLVVKATWCGPCKAYTPVLEAAKSEIETKGYTLEFVDADEKPEVVQKYGVRGVPTTIILDGEDVLTTLVGNRTKNEILVELL